MDIAKEVVQEVLDKLAPGDSVGIVLFSDDACAPKPLGPLNCTNLAALKRGVEVRAGRGAPASCLQASALLLCAALGRPGSGLVFCLEFPSRRMRTAALQSILVV